MESKLACTLVLALAILIGFAFVGFGEAKASEFNLAEFQPARFSAVACCHPEFNNKAFKSSQFDGKASLKVFAFNNPEFQGNEIRSFNGRFFQDSALATNNFRAVEFKSDFGASATNRADFPLSENAASFNAKTFARADFFDAFVFTPASLKTNDFAVGFDVAAFDKSFASLGCCKSVGFAVNNFPGFDGQFQAQS